MKECFECGNEIVNDICNYCEKTEHKACKYCRINLDLAELVIAKYENEKLYSKDGMICAIVISANELAVKFKDSINAE